MSQSFAARMRREMALLTKDPVEGITITPEKNIDSVYICTITGPAGTPYQGGIFKLRMLLSHKYPLTPPIVKFLTPIFHPNISTCGWVCLNFLGEDWSPEFNLKMILLHIQALLSLPNPDDALVIEIGAAWKANEAEALKTAREWTKKYAMDPESTLDIQIDSEINNQKCPQETYEKSLEAQL